MYDIKVDKFVRYQTSINYSFLISKYKLLSGLVDAKPLLCYL